MELDGFTFEKRYCLRCSAMTWHILNKWGTWFCLLCRAEDRDLNSPVAPIDIPLDTH